MRLCVIDGRGGGLGKRLIEELKTYGDLRHTIVALGTNHVAANAMSKAGAMFVDVGETAIVNIVPTTAVILAPLNAVISGSMWGEITPRIAEAIRLAPAHKLLVPITGGQFEVVGVESHRLSDMIRQTVERALVLMKSDRSLAVPTTADSRLPHRQTTKV